MEPLKLVFIPEDQLYHFTTEGMSFAVTVTVRASTVEHWIRTVKERFLDAAPTKCVGLDCEFTNPREGNQRAAVLQLSVASETLVFQICYANEVPQLLKDFLGDNNIRFCGAAIQNDVDKLIPYNIAIASAHNLQTIIPNPREDNQTPSLYALSNATIGTDLVKKQRDNNKKKKKKKKKKKNKQEDKDAEVEYDLIFGWGNCPLSFEQVKYAALDARLGFEIARRHWQLRGYNRPVDHLNIKEDE